MLVIQTEMGTEEEEGHSSPRTSHGMGWKKVEKGTNRFEAQLAVLYAKQNAPHLCLPVLKCCPRLIHNSISVLS